jgi:hypothetical protein
VPEATAIRVPHYSPAENGAWCPKKSCKSYSCNRVSPTDSFSLVVIEVAISTRVQPTSKARRDDEHELSKPESALSRVESAWHSYVRLAHRAIAVSNYFQSFRGKNSVQAIVAPRRAPALPNGDCVPSPRAIRTEIVCPRLQMSASLPLIPLREPTRDRGRPPGPPERAGSSHQALHRCVRGSCHQS